MYDNLNYIELYRYIWTIREMEHQHTIFLEAPGCSLRNSH